MVSDSPESVRYMTNELDRICLDTEGDRHRADISAVINAMRALDRYADLLELIKKHVPNLGTLIRMPNTEHVSDAHNRAVRALREIAHE